MRSGSHGIDNRAVIVVVMGVSGSGKTTVGMELASRLGWTFVDGDSLHPKANVEKMRSGQPLTDHDREEWLLRIEHLIHGTQYTYSNLILACSALKRRYRERLWQAGSDVRFVFLQVLPLVAVARSRGRRGHFMPPELVASQFAALEEPPAAFIVDASQPVKTVVDQILAWLDQEPASMSNSDA